MLVGKREYGIDGSMLEFLVKEVQGTVELGVQVAIVIGGGNSAIEESLLLLQHVRSLKIIHQFDELLERCGARIKFSQGRINSGEA